MEEASDGADALVVLKVFRPDIIITDWMMAPMDGVEFTRRIRTDKNSPNILTPIIRVSGYTGISQIQEARDAGVNEFLAKPISPEMLYHRIAEVISRPRQFVRTKTFFGPDRQRHKGDEFKGKGRRKSDIDAGMEEVEKLVS